MEPTIVIEGGVGTGRMLRVRVEHDPGDAAAGFELLRRVLPSIRRLHRALREGAAR